MFDDVLTTVAFCWRLVRRDGAALGFTSHDRDLSVGGLTYRASPGMLPAAVERGPGDRPDVAGAVTHGLLAEDDLLAGRWDGAVSRLFAVDWTAPETAQVVLADGVLGEVGLTGRRFEAALLGPAAALDAPACEVTSPTCRADLGDQRCRVDMGGRRTRGRAASGDGNWVTLAEPAALAPFLTGELLWLAGANAGLRARIAAVDGPRVRLDPAPPSAVEAGTAVRLSEGCDKRFATCRDRFANHLNFRGEPFLPGNDLLTRYPGA